jgi:hypothetical protein
MMLRRLAIISLLSFASLATEPNAATRRWWSHIVALSGDNLQGRDTGSEAYREGAQYVVTQFERAGLKPAGEHAYYQTVPLHQIRLLPAESHAALVRGETTTDLRWLHQITIRMQEGMPDKIDLPLVFAGTSDPPDGFNAEGKIVISLNSFGPKELCFMKGLLLGTSVKPSACA